MKNYWRQRLTWYVLLALLLTLFSSTTTTTFAAPAKNVIILMTDGTAASHLTLTRWYKGAPLALDAIVSGAVRTYSAESLITDSAPAATAFATGHKTNSKFLGILPKEVSIPGLAPILPEQQLKPVASILETAKLAGKATGLVATSNIQHASPAAFSSHTPFRDQYVDIAEQQVYLNIDVVFGGGKQYLLPKQQGGARTDGKNLVDVLTQRGYRFVDSRSSFFQLQEGKVWGLFAPNAMAYDFDRQAVKPQEPSLAEMTQKAIDLLSKNTNGFFLFVEASKVDWAAHANDPIGVVSDLLAYDEAVKTALQFAKADGNTLVLAVADHGTGGLSIGGKSLTASYDKTPFSAIIPPLKRADLTAEAILDLLSEDFSAITIKQILSNHYGISDLTPAEIELILKTGPTKKLISVIGHMLSNRSGLGWIYTGHTGEDLFLYSFGPGRPIGLIENTDIAKISASVMNLSLTNADRRLFVDAANAFPGAKGKLETNDQGIVFAVTKNDLRAEFFANTNVMKVNGQLHNLQGLIIHIQPTGKTYLPAQAVDIAKAAGF